MRSLHTRALTRMQAKVLPKEFYTAFLSDVAKNRQPSASESCFPSCLAVCRGTR